MEAVDMGLSLACALAAWALSGLSSLVLAVLACIHAARNGREWWWYAVIVGMPMIGPLLYFAASRAWAPAADSRGTPRQRRRQAEARLRDLNAQLAHWRGPSVLAEAGEELLALERWAEAEAHFREAAERGASRAETHFGLAEACIEQGRLADAVPLLEDLVKEDPEHGGGRALMLLARCLDELDHGREAEDALRRVLERHDAAEARVRLARRLVLSGRATEGRALAHDVVAEEATLAPALRRARRQWTQAARRISAGDTGLPKGPVRDVAPPSRWPRIVAFAIGGSVIVALVAGAFVGVRKLERAKEEMLASQRADIAAAERASAVRRAWPWTRGTDPATVVLEESDVVAYLAVRRAMQGVTRQPAEPPAASGEWLDPGTRQAMSLLDACDAARVDPVALPLLANVIEWRFLRREPAAVAALSPSAREQAFAILRWLGAGDTSSADEAAWRAEQESMLADILATAPPDAGLAPQTRALLELHRDELESLDPASVRDLCLAAAEVERLEMLAALRTRP